jgi:hypothetical protein
MCAAGCLTDLLLLGPVMLLLLLLLLLLLRIRWLS